MHIIHSHLETLALKYCEQVRSLGVIIDVGLSFEKQISHVTKKIIILSKNISKKLILRRWTILLFLVD